MSVRLWAFLFIVFALFAPAAAGELQDLARQAEEKAQAGKHAEALDTIREAVYSVWGKTPLFFRRAIFVSKPASGYGVFQQRDSNVFAQGEPLLIYAEPIGFGWRKNGPVNHSEIVADFELRDLSGKILAGQRNFGTYTFDSYERNMEYFLNLTYRLSGLPPGKYVTGTTLRDSITGKSASFDLEFEVK